jgi:hypothetical protein
VERLDTLGEHTSGPGAGVDAPSQPRVVGRDLVRAPVAALLAVAALVAARRHRAVLALVTTAAQMALTLVYWQQMVRYLDRHR